MDKPTVIGAGSTGLSDDRKKTPKYSLLHVGMGG